MNTNFFRMIFFGEYEYKYIWVDILSKTGEYEYKKDYTDWYSQIHKNRNMNIIGHNIDNIYMFMDKRAIKVNK